MPKWNAKHLLLLDFTLKFRMKYAQIGHNKCAECDTLYVPNLPPPISDSQQYEI